MDARLGTFNGLFASAAYFGLIATAGPANHMDLQPQLGLEVSHTVSVTAGWLVFWRREVADLHLVGTAPPLGGWDPFAVHRQFPERDRAVDGEPSSVIVR